MGVQKEKSPLNRKGAPHLRDIAREPIANEIMIEKVDNRRLTGGGIAQSEQRLWKDSDHGGGRTDIDI